MEKFISHYNEVFNADGTVKNCGREKCRKLIKEADNIDKREQHGNIRNAIMEIDKIKELADRIKNSNDNKKEIRLSSEKDLKSEIENIIKEVDSKEKIWSAYINIKYTEEHYEFNKEETFETLDEFNKNIDRLFKNNIIKIDIYLTTENKKCETVHIKYSNYKLEITWF